ncbi:MAG: hypothetical protein LBE18_08800 [Planctomycetaceae bacterium]|jgi:hypothetical protein|nr:hypothetical protein [Planctomycetaceae bacterium]
MSITIQENNQADCRQNDVSATEYYNIKNITDWILANSGQLRIVVSDNNSELIRLIYRFIESVRRTVIADNGQYIHIDSHDLIGGSLSKRLHSILVEILANRPYRIQLPIILQHNPHSASPFIDRAIIWQRLCDLILEDDVPQRPTVLFIENLEIADHNIQHELARLIRLHKNNKINRTFLATITNNNIEQLLPELQELIQIVPAKSFT